VFDCVLQPQDFCDFTFIETELKTAVFGEKARNEARNIRWFLIHRPSRRLVRKWTPAVKGLLSRIAQIRFFRPS